MGTVVDGSFEWEAEKAASNLKDHGVSFEEAATVFADPNYALVDDGSGTSTYKLIGFSIRARVLVVVHIERGNRDRIISAWPATPAERSLLQQQTMRPRNETQPRKEDGGYS